MYFNRQTFDNVNNRRSGNFTLNFNVDPLKENALDSGTLEYCRWKVTRLNHAQQCSIFSSLAELGIKNPCACTRGVFVDSITISTCYYGIISNHALLKLNRIRVWKRRARALGFAHYYRRS